MSTIDIVLIAIVLIGAFAGYRKGFLMELVTLLGLILGILGGFKLMGHAMLMLEDRFNINEKVLPYLAFAVVFVIIIIVVSLIGKMIQSSLDKTLLGSADKIAGAVLGVFKMAFMVSVVIWILDALQISFLDSMGEDSMLYALTASIAPIVTSWIGEVIPAFSDIF